MKVPRPRLALLRPRRRTREASPGQQDTTRLSARDLVAEATAGMLQRPARSLLTALGTVLGVGAFVAVLGLTATAAAQIDTRFNVLSATEVSIEDVSASSGDVVGGAFPPDADARLTALNGVRAAGTHWPVRLFEDDRLTTSLAAGARTGAEQPSVTAATPGALTAVGARLREGSLFGDHHERNASEVVLIGQGLAARLGITTLESRPTVFIGTRPFVVMGVIGGVDRKAESFLSVVVPRSTALQLWGPPEEGAGMIVSTELGAAPQIAHEAAHALRPDHPEYFSVVPPPDPKALRGGVSTDLGQLFLVLAAICLLIGAVGIANTTLVAVLERTGEIGLRRSLGARARHITAQFLAESGVLGALGGLVGTSLGALTVVGVALNREWTPVLHPGVVAAAPLIGLATGLLAGVYPAWRASRIEPAEALRR
ncbi:ABC transporter permease [Streptomyces sp. NPDC057552]|uniref:ABC transporter permease n=1 Tax=Streptomyces sp. NPDC057552 TaxID=3350537 RepID=UPI003692112C